MKRYLGFLSFCFFSSMLLGMHEKITLPSKEALDEEFKKLISYHHIKKAGIIGEFGGKEMFPIRVISDVPSYVLNYYQTKYTNVENNKTDNLNILLTVMHLNRSLNLIKRILLKDYPDIIKEFEEKGAIEVEQ